MAGLVRKTLIQFGQSGPTSDFGQFGSKEAGLPQTSQDPAVIQALSAWVQGWQNAVVSGDKAAYLEDMNGWCFVHSYELAYVFQMGIPEWDSATLYFTGSIVQTASTGQWFRSLQGGVPGSGAGQSGNTPPSGASNAFWMWINPPQNNVGTATLNKLPKVTNTAPSVGVTGSVTLGDSAVSDDGTDVILALPLKFADNTVQSTAASPVTVQSSVTGSRAIGTTYQNTTGKVMWVTVSIAQSPGQSVLFYTDNNLNPTTLIGQLGNNSNPSQYTAITFIVLPGNYYKATGSGGIVGWTEWN